MQAYCFAWRRMAFLNFCEECSSELSETIVEINDLRKLFLNYQEIDYRPGKGRKGRKGTRMFGNPIRCPRGRPCRVGLSRRS